MNITVCGIDYSLTSPAICVFSTPKRERRFTLSGCAFFFLYANENMVSREYDLIDFVDEEFTDQYPTISGQYMRNGFDQNIERYNFIASWAISCLPMVCDCVTIEDYAYNARGRNFDIGENGGVLKYLLWKKHYRVTTVAPTVVKKFATGSGRAGKEEMEEAFLAETKLDLRSLLQLTDKQVNPISDIIDAYYIAKYSYQNIA